MRLRILGAALFGLVGFACGAGTGIVGGVFGSVAGASVFTILGAVYGWSAGPDIWRFCNNIINKIFKK